MSMDSFEEYVSNLDINPSALVDIGKSDGCYQNSRHLSQVSKSSS